MLPSRKELIRLPFPSLIHRMDLEIIKREI